MLDGYQPGDPVVRVLTYQADPAGRTAEQIADEAFDTFNDHPRDPDGADLARVYYERRLRSLSFPGMKLCCGRSCCVYSPFTSALCGPDCHRGCRPGMATGVPFPGSCEGLDVIGDEGAQGAWRGAGDRFDVVG
jgi:hypothetical protein